MPLPALCLAVLAHLPALEQRFAQMGLRVTVERTYSPRTQRVTLTFACDPQSDRLLQDERRVLHEAREHLIADGFYVHPAGPHALTLDGFYGRMPQIRIAA